MRMHASPGQRSGNILPQVFSELCCKVSEEEGKRKGRRREEEREERRDGWNDRKGRERGKRGEGRMWGEKREEEGRKVRYKEVGRGRKGGSGGSRGRLLLRFYQHISTALIDIVKITAL